ncbi:MAG: hypothetical protein IJM15_00270 [Erysipelotrichaceae bacterium]|nr:hypothetical protein [Erysipelotrichaceae bacterium]
MDSSGIRKKLKAVIAMALIVIFLIAVYVISPDSKVKNINITGNYFLSDGYILEKCGIGYDDNFLFLFPGKRKTDDPLISSIRISKVKNNCVNIAVQENTIVGYILTGEGKATVTSLLLKDGSMVRLEPSKIKSLALIPFIDGFTGDEEFEKLAQQLSQIDEAVLYRVSEIKKNPLSYDADMVKFLMDDGYAIYCNIRNLAYLNNYFEIVARYKSSYGCILIDDLTSTAVSIACDSIDRPQQ